MLLHLHSIINLFLIKRKKALFIAALILCSQLHAQNVDSLMQIFRDKSTPDSIRLDLLKNQDLLGLSHTAVFNQPDSTISYSKTIYSFAKTRDLKAYIARAYSIIGTGYFHKGNRLNALDYYLKVLKIVEQINDTVKSKNSLLSGLYNNLGLVYWREEKYDMALDDYYKSKESWEKMGNNSIKASLYFLNTGLVYMDEKEYDQAENQLFIQGKSRGDVW